MSDNVREAILVGLLDRWPGDDIRVGVQADGAVVVWMAHRPGEVFGFVGATVSRVLCRPVSVQAFAVCDGRMRMVLADGPGAAFSAVNFQATETVTQPKP